MTRRDVLAELAATALVAAVPSPASTATAGANAPDVDYDLVTPSGTLGGTLTLPAVSHPPVALIIAGSGPTDRNGNSALLRCDTYRLLAAALASRGIATVRYDKRGIGASRAAGVDEEKLRFDTLVDDAARWIAKLRADARLGRVAIAGHSEGSLIGMLAAAKTNVDAFVSLEGVGFPAADAIRRQMAPQLAALPDVAAENERILQALVAGKRAPDVPGLLQALYRPSVQPYLISWFKYDPRVAIAALTCKTVIVQGTFDLQVTADDARALAAANKAATLTLVERMSHTLKDAADATLVTQVKTVYADPSLPIDAAVPAAVALAIAP